MTVTREVTWGEAVVVAGFRTPGGLKHAVARIHAAVGEHIGTRNTFAKLYKVTDPASLTDRDQFRAWLLITALNEEPQEWGVSEAVVPRGFDLDELRLALRSGTGIGVTHPYASIPDVAA